MYVDEVSAIVLDPGSCTTRAGFAGEDVPKSVLSTHYGLVSSSDTERKPYFGDNYIHTLIPNLEIKNPWSSEGIVEDWDYAAKLWEHSITSRLTGARPGNPAKNGLNENGEEDIDMDAMDEAEKPLSESPLLMTEPSFNPTKSREKSIEIAMEDWGCPAYYLGRNGVMAA